MFKTFLKSYEINFAQNVNIWIYYLSKLPLIGRIIPDTLYSSTKSKTIASNIIRIFSFLFAFIKKFIYVFLIIILPSLIISKEKSLDSVNLNFHIFFFLSFIAGPFANNLFTNSLYKDFYMINLMRFNAKKYYLSNMLFSYLGYFIFFLFPIKLLGCTFGESIIIAFEFISFRAIVQAFYLLTCRKNGAQLSSKLYFIIPIIFIPFLIAYVLPLLGFVFNIKNLLLNVFFIIIILLIAISSIIYLTTYKNYTLLAKKLLLKDDLNKLTSTADEAMFVDVQLKENKIDSKSLINDNYKNKSGLDYLNAKFIERHKSILINPIKIRVTAIIILTIISSIIVILNPDMHSKINKLILASTGFMVFILYFISIGEKATKAYFFNCDHSLLKFKFYTDPKIILDNFKCRLKTIILLNLIPAICIALCLSVILILTKGNIIDFIPVFISILAISCLFSVHYLFLYYFTQPYTSQLTIKSPIYSALSFIIWIFAYGCLQVKTASLLFTLSIIALTILYTLVALFLVYKYAPKNFRLK